MAKASSPMRLQAELVGAAALAGKSQHRSTAEQIEYWASIGRSVSGLIDPDNLLAISTGLARLSIEPVTAAAVDPDAVFTELEQSRADGSLAQRVVAAGVKYQASAEHPGLLEQIDADGKRVPGRFSNGVFTPLDFDAA